MSHPIRSRVEALESRIAPAGVVTVDFTNGVLTLTGDASGNSFSVTMLDATTIELAGSGGTDFQVEGGLPTASLRVTAPLKSLAVTLGSGLNQVDFVGLKVGGDVELGLGSGTNDVEFLGLSSKGALTITGGGGADTIELGGTAISVKKGLTLDLQGGANNLAVTAAAFNVGGDFTFTAGAGEDSAFFVGGTVGIRGNATFTLGDGVVEIGTAVFTVGKNLLVDNTSSALALTSSGLLLGATLGSSGSATATLTINGNLTYRGGATQDGIATAVSGRLTVKGIAHFTSGGGEANFALAASSASFGRFEIDATGSSDLDAEIQFDHAKIARGIKILGSDAEDEVQVIVRAGAIGAIDLQLGEGQNDTHWQMTNTKIASVAITSGAGDENIAFSLANGKIVGNFDVKAGAGESTTSFGGLDATVGGLIRVENGAHAGGSVEFALHSFGSGSGSLKAGGVLFIPGDGGSSSLALEGMKSLTVNKEIAIAGGSGDDQLRFVDSMNIRAGKGFNLALGDGSNSVTGFVPNLNALAFKVVGGAGNDIIDFAATGSLGAVTAQLRAGQNQVRFDAGDDRLGIKSLHFTSESLAGSNDGLQLFNVQMSGALIARLGAGASNVDIRDSSFGGTFNLSTDAGADMVGLDPAASGVGVVLAKAAVIDLGADNDVLTIGGNSTSALLTTRSTFRANGGDGTDTLVNPTSNIYKKEPEFIGFE